MPIAYVDWHGDYAKALCEHPALKRAIGESRFEAGRLSRNRRKLMAARAARMRGDFRCGNPAYADALAQDRMRQEKARIVAGRKYHAEIVAECEMAAERYGDTCEVPAGFDARYVITSERLNQWRRENRKRMAGLL